MYTHGKHMSQVTACAVVDACSCVTRTSVLVRACVTERLHVAVHDCMCVCMCVNPRTQADGVFNQVTIITCIGSLCLFVAFVLWAWRFGLLVFN